MTVNLELLIAGMRAANVEAIKAMIADNIINPGSMNNGTTGVPSGFRANVWNAYNKAFE